MSIANQSFDLLVEVSKDSVSMDAIFLVGLVEGSHVMCFNKSGELVNEEDCVLVPMNRLGSDWSLLIRVPSVSDGDIDVLGLFVLVVCSRLTCVSRWCAHRMLLRHSEAAMISAC